MAMPSRRFAFGQQQELDVSLRTMERMIDGWMTKKLSDGSIVPDDGLRWDVPEHPDGTQPIEQRWDFPERSKLLQATRHLTFPRTIGHGTLMIARALGSDKQEPRERVYGVRTQATSLEWYSSDQITNEDIICTRLGIDWQGDVRKVAAGLLMCLDRARPLDTDVPDAVAEQPAGLAGEGRPVVIPRPRNAPVLDVFPRIT